MAREHSGQGWSQQTRDRELWGTRGTRGSHSGEKRKQGCVCTMWAATGALSKAEQTQSWWERAMTISRWGVWRLIQALAQSRWWQSLAQRQASQELRGTSGGHRAPVQRQVEGSHRHTFKKEGSLDILQRSLISGKLNLRCQWNMEVKAFSGRHAQSKPADVTGGGHLHASQSICTHMCVKTRGWGKNCRDSTFYQYILAAGRRKEKKFLFYSKWSEREFPGSIV